MWGSRSSRCVSSKTSCRSDTPAVLTAKRSVRPRANRFSRVALRKRFARDQLPTLLCRRYAGRRSCRAAGGFRRHAPAAARSAGARDCHGSSHRPHRRPLGPGAVPPAPGAACATVRGRPTSWWKKFPPRREASVGLERARRVATNRASAINLFLVAKRGCLHQHLSGFRRNGDRPGNRPTKPKALHHTIRCSPTRSTRWWRNWKRG